jgi:hypothetical protein
VDRVAREDRAVRWGRAAARCARDFHRIRRGRDFPQIRQDRDSHRAHDCHRAHDSRQGHDSHQVRDCCQGASHQVRDLRQVRDFRRQVRADRRGLASRRAREIVPGRVIVLIHEIGQARVRLLARAIRRRRAAVPRATVFFRAEEARLQNAAARLLNAAGRRLAAVSIDRDRVRSPNASAV